MPRADRPARRRPRPSPGRKAPPGRKPPARTTPYPRKRKPGAVRESLTAPGFGAYRGGRQAAGTFSGSSVAGISGWARLAVTDCFTKAMIRTTAATIRDSRTVSRPSCSVSVSM